MIYKQLSYLPIIFQVDENIFLKVKYFLKRNKLIFGKVLVVSGRTVSFNHAKELATLNEWDTYVLEDNTFAEVENLKEHVNKNRFDLIIAVGGGKILDSVKRVSYLTNINHLSMPTIISNDGLISPISVIKNKKGKTESIPGMMPMGVIIDLDIIKNSPLQYLRAAAGDILSNLSSTNDWIIATREDQDNINDIGFHLSKSAANALLHFERKDLNYKPFLRMVIQGQVNSGIAMSLAGSSRPCSGSEHLISHAIDFLGLSYKVLHGVQVASISLFMLFLQGKLKNLHVEYALATGIPLNFQELLVKTDESTLRNLYNKAKEMRPGRVTILDLITEDVFIEKLREYEFSFLEKLDV